MGSLTWFKRVNQDHLGILATSRKCLAQFAVYPPQNSLVVLQTVVDLFQPRDGCEMIALKFMSGGNGCFDV